VNFLYCDYDLRRAAMAVDDKRLGTMIKESAQMISTARCDYISETDPGYGDPVSVAAEFGLYRPTHRWHPVTQWVKHSLRNQSMMLRYAQHLCDVYEMAFGHRDHMSIKMIENLASMEAVGPDRPGTTPHNSARNDGKGIDCTHYPTVVLSYRYYMLARWATDARRATWRGRTPPAWRHWPELGMTTGAARRAS
jgi:hypothetical protein